MDSDQSGPGRESGRKREASEGGDDALDARPATRRRIGSPNQDAPGEPGSDIAPADPGPAARPEVEPGEAGSEPSEAEFEPSEAESEPEPSEAARRRAILDGSWGARAAEQAAAQLEHIETASFVEVVFDEDWDDEADQFKQMWLHSPELRKIVREATAAGPITVRWADEDADVQGGIWRAGPRIIEIEDETAPAEDSVVFELINATNASFYETPAMLARLGRYEAVAGEAGPDAAAMLYARDCETIEWTTVWRHHAVFTELRNAGVPLDEDADMFADMLEPDGSGAEAKWADFERFFAQQLDEGHSQSYIDQYHMLRAAGSGGVDASAAASEIGKTRFAALNARRLRRVPRLVHKEQKAGRGEIRRGSRLPVVSAEQWTWLAHVADIAIPRGDHSSGTRYVARTS